MKKMVIGIAIASIMLFATGASASPASQFNKWIIAANPIIQRYTKSFTALNRDLKAENVNASLNDLANISNDGVALSHHENSGDPQLNSDIKAFSRTIIIMASVGLKTIDGGPISKWTNVLYTVALNEQAMISDLHYDSKRYQ
jgi:hypothetical protein